MPHEISAFVFSHFSNFFVEKGAKNALAYL